MNIYTFEITSLNWNRIFLEFTISTNYEKEIEYKFFCYQTKELIDINYDNNEKGNYHFSLNTTAIKGNNFLNNGKWRILAYFNNTCEICTCSTSVAYELKNLDKIFKYGKNDLYSYNVSFSLTETNMTNFILIIHSQFMKVNNKWYERKFINELFHKKDFINNLSKDLKLNLMNLTYKIFNFFSFHKRVMFMSETKEYIWGNLKAVDDRIKERNLDINVIYSFRRAVGTHKSFISWITTIWKISRCNTIIVDDYVPIFNFLKLDTKVDLVQLWHGGAGFKAVGYCRFGKNGSPFPVQSCHKNYTKAVIGSDQLIKVFEEVFGLPKEYIYPYGMPRLDSFLNKEIIEETKHELYEEFPFLEEKKIILFAPTYRGIGQKTAYYDFSNINLAELYDVCKEKNYLFLIKMHPFITQRIKIPTKYKKHIIEFSDYKYINNLYYISEMLITDYSSNYYEFSLMQKPILFYTYDREEYELTRGVYQDIKESAPGKVCDNFKELIDSLKNDDFDLYKTKKFVKDNFKNSIGNASDNIIDNIILKEGTK